MSSSHAIAELGAAEVDRVERLWKQMVAYHRALVGDTWEVRSGEDAWQRRRVQYGEWLDSGEGQILIAEREGAGEPDGYAALVVGPGGPTWDLGERVGELESLVVAEDARSEGVGTMLIDACRERLGEEGVAFWSVGVVEANVGATCLYERAGFRPFYRQLLARTG